MIMAVEGLAISFEARKKIWLNFWKLLSPANFSRGNRSRI